MRIHNKYVKYLDSDNLSYENIKKQEEKLKNVDQRQEDLRGQCSGESPEQRQ